MNVMLDNYTLPQTGQVAVNVNVAFEIQIAAETAQRKVSAWLLNEVSYLIGAESPLLVLGERPVWRVPARIGFPSIGRVGVIGNVDVDVETGEMLELSGRKAKMLRYLEEEVRPNLPQGRNPVHELPPDYIAKLDPPPQVVPR